MTVHLISTGGTLEKIYHEPTGEIANVGSKLDRYLRLLRLPDLQVKIHPLMNIDSLEMQDEDRERILMLVRELVVFPEPIVITHGTDTMVQTGLFLKERLESVKVPIVMTGAMTPLGFEGSDGLQNLAESLFAIRLLNPGIYIVFHNQVLPINQVEKDRDRATFRWKIP